MATADQHTAPPVPRVAAERVRALLAPRSLALVGASERSGWANLVLASNERVGFRGDLHLVHPRATAAFGRGAVATLRDLDEPVDLAFIVAGGDALEPILDDMAASGVRNGIVLASGFGESGVEGRSRERTLLERARALDITLLGPNCVGFVNNVARVAPFSLPFPALPLGPIAVATQSGALATHMMTYAQARGVGVSTLVSLGNGMMVGAADIVDVLLDDDATRAVCLFLESLGDPQRFREVAAKADGLGKPLVALTVGRSPSGQRAARSHTGAVAGDDAVADAALAQVNVVRVDSLEEMLDSAAAATYYRRPRGRRAGVVSASGGACGLIADRASGEGLALPALAERTAAAIAAFLPPFAAVQNPLDVTAVSYGAATAVPGAADQPPDSLMAIDRAMDVMVDDPGLDLLLYTGIPRPPERPGDPEAAARLAARLGWVARRAASAPIPVYSVALTCTDVGDHTRELLAGHDLPLLGGLDGAVRAVGNVVRWVERAGWSRRPDRSPARPGAAVALEHLPAAAGTWSEEASRRWLAGFGVPLVPAELVVSADGAAAAAGAVGGPVAMKICSPDIAHKSEIGGVRVGVQPADARATYTELSAAGHAVAGARIEGVLVSPMCQGGIELFAGVTRDPTFGPVLALGLGGVWVEVLKDVALRVLPVGAEDVVAMLRELRGAALLAGARGATPVDLEAVADAVARMCAAAGALGPSLESVEVNPLWADGAVVRALDALVVTAADAADGSDAGDAGADLH